MTPVKGAMAEPTGEYAICVATFYEELANRLVNGATEAFSEHEISPASVHTFEVPGAFELPLAAKYCADTGDAFSGKDLPEFRRGIAAAVQREVVCEAV